MVPVEVDGDATTWATISAGPQHTCATRTNGTAWCWGSGDALGEPSVISRESPIKVRVGTNWKSVSAGQFHTCGIRTDGTAWCWGVDSEGQLGNGTEEGTNRLPNPVAGGATNWNVISAGQYFTCATRTDGTAWCWGQNDSGQLGDGITTGRQAPTQVAGATSGWVTVDGGSLHTVGLTRDGDN